MNDSLLSILHNAGIIPVVALHTEQEAVGLAGALKRGGIATIEVTYRTPQASEAIRAIRRAHPKMTVGAGTVLTPRQLLEAKEAGAHFAVMPGYDEGMLLYGANLGFPLIPGVSNASEIQRAVNTGCSVLKFFPCEPLGGVSAITFLSAPFPSVRFIPAGGITRENILSYLACERVVACGGGFVARAEQIKRMEWGAIEAQCSDASAAIASVRGKEGSVRI